MPVTKLSSKSPAPILDQLLDTLDKRDGDQSIIRHARKLSGVCDGESLQEAPANLPGLILAVNQTVVHATLDALNQSFQSVVDMLTYNPLALLKQNDKE